MAGACTLWKLKQTNKQNRKHQSKVFWRGKRKEATVKRVLIEYWLVSPSTEFIVLKSIIFMDVKRKKDFVTADS